jgi:hypothetical protein
MKKKITMLIVTMLGGLSYYLYTKKEKVNSEIENHSLDNDYVVYFDNEPTSKGKDDMFV